jgi:hypothetical protein
MLIREKVKIKMLPSFPSHENLTLLSTYERASFIGYALENVCITPVFIIQNILNSLRNLLI